MSDEIRVDLTGIDAIAAQFRLLPQEIEKALRSASVRALQTGRAAARQSLAPVGQRVKDTRKDGKAFQVRRIPSSKGRIWIGANAPGALIALDGTLPPGQFSTKPFPDGTLRPVYRRMGNRAERVRVNILPDAEAARDTARDAAETRFLEAFVAEAKRLLAK